MLFTKELEKKLGADNFKLIQSELKGKEVYLLDAKDYMPIDKVSELRNDNKSLKADKEKLTTDLEKSNSEIETLKKGKGDETKTLEQRIAEQDQKILEMANEAKSKDEKILVDSKRTLIDNKFRDSGVTDPNNRKLLVREFEAQHPLKELEIANNIVSDDLIKPFKETYKPLFGEIKQKGFKHNVSGDEYSGVNPFAKDTLNLTEQGKLYKENPKLAEELQAMV